MQSDLPIDDTELVFPKTAQVQQEQLPFDDTDLVLPQSVVPGNFANYRNALNAVV